MPNEATGVARPAWVAQFLILVVLLTVCAALLTHKCRQRQAFARDICRTDGNVPKTLQRDAPMH